MNKIQLPTEFDPYRDSTDLPIELLAIKEEKWTQIAHEVIGENSESRKKGLTDLKSRCTDLKLPFLNDEKLSDEEKSTLESKFWLMVLRAGGMDPERAHQVLMNYIGIINQHPEYFAASKPPTKLDPVFQQKVLLKIYRVDIVQCPLLISISVLFTPDIVLGDKKRICRSRKSFSHPLKDYQM